MRNHLHSLGLFCFVLAFFMGLVAPAVSSIPILLFIFISEAILMATGILICHLTRT